MFKKMPFDFKKEFKEFYMPKNEPETVAIMDKYIEENGYRNDFSGGRLHHEIYMSDARRIAPCNWKTVIRHPICKL